MEERTIQKIGVWHYLKMFLPLFLVAFLSCAASLFFLRNNPDHLLVFDDSYITLKFAANFFKYKGITYDGASYLTGATSPLHVILVALMGLFFKMETASLLVGIVFFVLSSFLIYLWTHKMYNDRRIALLAGVMMSTSGWLVFDSLNGLETTTFIFFSLLTFYLFYVYKYKVFYIVPLSLSILTRPEGWFIACALWTWKAIQYVIQKDKQTLRHLSTSLGIFILLVTPYFLLSLYYTESILPSTAFSKGIFFAEGSMPFINKVGFFKNRLLPFYITLLFPVPLLIFPLMFCARRVVALPYLWLYFIIFYFSYFLFFPGAIQHYWYRYQHIFIPIFIMAIAGGTYELITICKQKFLRIAMAVVICLCLVYNQRVSFECVKNIYLNQTGSTKHTLINLALWIKHNTPEDSLIALHDIGVVGYFSDREIIDLVGLINPEVTKYYWDENMKRPLPIEERKIIDYLKEKKPDYLVMIPEWDRYFNFFQYGNEKPFELIHTSNPLFPTELRYKVYKCNWEQ